MNPQIERLIEALAARNATLPKMWTLPPTAARARVDSLMGPLNDGGPAMAETFEIAMPVHRGQISATVYVPEGLAATAPGLLYLHGGGFVIMSPRTHDRLTRELAAGIGARVVSLDYGLAPEHPYPEALHDAADAVRWLEQHADELGIDRHRLLIGGDSAGATLAVATMLWLRDAGDTVPFRAALLLYGAFTLDETPSMRAWGDRDIVLSKQIREWFHSHYLSGGGAPDDPYLSPLKAKLTGLPPAILIVGDLDPLMSDSQMLADALLRAGVPAELHVVADAIHGFMQFPMLDMTGAAIAQVCRFVQTYVAPRSAIPPSPIT